MRHSGMNIGSSAGDGKPVKMEPLFDEDYVTPDVRPDLLDRIEVRYLDQKRLVLCFCEREVSRSIVPHLKEDHPEVWAEWVQHFVELRALGFPSKRIMRLYQAGNGVLLFSWTVIDRAVRKAIESGTSTFNPVLNTTVSRWEPESFQPSTGTIWDFPRRGNWAVHSGDYRGNWPPQLVRNLILKFTEPGDLIIDPFVGGGTTLIEAWLCGRKSVGIDISRLALQTTKAKLKHMSNLARNDHRAPLLEEYTPVVISGDALRLKEVLDSQGIPPGMASMVCAHPPYLDSIRYTENDERDLSLIRDASVFHNCINVFASQAFNTLTDGGVCAFLIGDVRKRGRLISLGINSVSSFQQQGFTLESIVIKTQNWDRSAEFYRNQAQDSYLLEHEYLLIFRK